MIWRKKNDPLVASARGTAKATRDQVGCHKVMGNGDPSYAMAGGCPDGFFRERLFKDCRVVIHRREPRRFDCHGGAHPDNK